MDKIQKTELKPIKVLDKYTYHIFLVMPNGGDTWLEARPAYKGVVRTANTQAELLMLITNDCLNLEREEQRVRQ